MFDVLANYRDFEELFGPYDQQSYWGYTATRGSVSFVGLNSAWLCCARPKGETDRGALRVEPAVLEKLVQNLPDDTLRVALLHHPLDWLEETTRSAVSDLLINNADLVLFGHVHANDVVGQIKGNAKSVFLQAPPLRADWSKGTNGYAIVRTDTEHKKFEVQYRSYSKSQRTFVSGEDFAPTGRMYPRPEDADFFRNSPPLSALLRRFAETESVDYLDWYRTHIRSKSKVTGSFVIPKVHHVTASQEGPFLDPPQSLTHVVAQSACDQFFVAPLDAGSTTAAYLTFKHLSETFSVHRQVPAYFDAGRESINKASILRKISQTTPIRYSHMEAEQLVDEAAVVVVVDGLCLGDVEQFNLFRDTVDRHLPNIRFLYFLSTERRGLSPTGVGEPRLYSSEDEIYEFAQLDVDGIRSMIAIRIPDKAEAVREGVVSHVVESFRQMDEPIFASTVAVVIDTITQDPEFKPLNKARLIERYVECLLGRFDLEDVREGAFSSSDKINFLAFVARQLLEENRVGMDEGRWHGLVSTYQARFLIELPRQLLKEFLDKGLLTMEGGEITFRGDHLFSFFVAQEMKRDADFAASLVEGPGLFRHYREITVYGELEGTNVAKVLNGVFQELCAIEETLLENYSRIGVDLTAEWVAACNEAEAKAVSESLDEAAAGLGTADATAEGADRHDNAELAKIDRRRGVSERQEVRESEARLLVGMRLYGLLLKNALHLEAPYKLRHLKKLYEAAELWVGFMCAGREAIGRHPIVIAGGVRFINLGAMVDKERSYRDFKFNAPNTVSRLIAGTMRNPQLSIAIRNLIGDLDPMSQLFARDVLLEMPGDQNRDAYLGSLKSEEDINLVICALRTLRIRYLSAGRNQDRRNYLESIVNAIAKDPRVARRVDFSKLRKARLVQDLRGKAAQGIE
ncbi:hypothetical protein [uncultured Roseobacter sp.]|uniref:hypothetical protein n=1 Tax=uncultured Roseobacter sp. TaxID=114847 RepID=UPI002613B5FE|nr:hypothetical protein [uncultured Roseobacter sp.]